MTPTKVVIGLMSGTSMDGLDAAAIQASFSDDGQSLAEFSVLKTLSMPLPTDLYTALTAVLADKTATLKQLCRLNVKVGETFAAAAKAMQAQLAADGIQADLVASHGQTIYHVPPGEGQAGSTWQLGDPSVIATATGLPVAADFRPADMALGGQGAPLVPFADRLLFGKPETAGAVHNLGGISNLTAIPATRTQAELPMMAFDTGPANMVCDALMTLLYGKPYDANGEVAARGQVHEGLRQAMLDDAYLNQPPPKSTGRERYGMPYAESLVKAWRDQVSAQDMLATATAVTAETIVQAYAHWVLPTMPLKTVWVGGGGVLNPTLMAAITTGLAPHGVAVCLVDDLGIPAQYREAIAFALLGLARLMEIPANVPACTGASSPAILGGLWLPPR